ncbi:MAG: MarR family transcriptional regulator [Erysipelotrichaceae bacterium]|nr:MarR family transcriptional regulator [Erysipelotrichaceae bacterium]MBR3694078.1 MarR family transcriptional regulator [Erysipelotrichales bacterium]
MERTKHTLNELLVWMFNYILYIEERNMKESGVNVSMNDVHTLERIKTASNNSMSHIARTLMVTQGTLTTNVAKLIKKGYVIKYKDENDKRITRLKITEKAEPILEIHDAFHENMINKMIGQLNLDENEVLNASLENILEYFRQEYSDKLEAKK